VIYNKPLLINDWLLFSDANFGSITAVYQTSSDDIVFFISGKIYIIEYPSL
jgi:hypothetical protein